MNVYHRIAHGFKGLDTDFFAEAKRWIFLDFVSLKRNDFFRPD
jgi:hypothetical protein